MAASVGSSPADGGHPLGSDLDPNLDVGQRVPQLAGRGGLGHGHAIRPMDAHLLGELRHVAAGAERHHLVAIGKVASDGKCLLPDATGAPEDREALATHVVSLPRTWAPVMPKRRSRAW
jgi:hypothetical protein